MDAAENIELSDKDVPTPTGYRLLVALPQIKETYGDTGIVKAQSEIKNEELSSMVVQVVDMGPDAYGDEKRFPNGAYCKVGDFVMIRAYSGTRFKTHGRELFRLINDDSVEAVVNDPNAFSRI